MLVGMGRFRKKGVVEEGRLRRSKLRMGRFMSWEVRMRRVRNQVVDNGKVEELCG
jgi:hypothetical protein